VGQPATQLTVQLGGDRHVIGRGLVRLGDPHPDAASVEVDVTQQQPLHLGLAQREVRREGEDQPVLREVRGLDQQQQLPGAEAFA
jgi:hypothetical protein